jgi:hypothetical protein
LSSIKKITVLTLEIKDTTVTQIFASYLDLHNETDNGGRFKKSNSTKNVMTSHFQ